MTSVIPGGREAGNRIEPRAASRGREPIRAESREPRAASRVPRPRAASRKPEETASSLPLYVNKFVNTEPRASARAEARPRERRFYAGLCTTSCLSHLLTHLTVVLSSFRQNRSTSLLTRTTLRPPSSAHRPNFSVRTALLSRDARSRLRARNRRGQSRLLREALRTNPFAKHRSFNRARVSLLTTILIYNLPRLCIHPHFKKEFRYILEIYSCEIK